MHDLIENGQKPEYLVIGCLDSRANPILVFGAKAGLVMPFTPPGAIVRPYHSDDTALNAALETGINLFGIRKVVVMGHTGCGAMNALVHGTENKRLRTFVDVAQQALHSAKAAAANDNANPDALLRATSEHSVLMSAQNLRGYPVVKELGDELTIYPWMFDMHHGVLEEFEGASGTFRPITPTPAKIQAHHKVAFVSGENPEAAQ
jgi:carbonic anhydrase